MMESSIFFFAACIGYLTTMVLADTIIWRKSNPDPLSDWRTLNDQDGLPQWPTDKSTLRELDLFLGFLAALGVSGVLIWLYQRVFAETIPVHQPLVLLSGKLGITLSARTANYMLVFFLVIGLYMLILLMLSNVRRPGGRYGIIGWFGRIVWANRWHVIAAFAVAVIAYTTLFTTFFTFRSTASFGHTLRDFGGPEKALTPLQIYKNTWDYWWDQHKLHRIKGPFHYYLPILFLYELPILLLAGLGWLRALRDTLRPWMHLIILGAMHVLLALVLWVLPPIDWDLMDAKFHLTHEAHLFLVLLYAQLLVYIAPMLFRQGRRVESFVTYWGVTSLFAYSYAGEKVPWLTVHTTGPLALLAAAELVRLWRQWGRRSSDVGLNWGRIAFFIVAIVGICYQIRNNHLLLIKHPWSPAERLVYNHTSPDIERAVAVADELGRRTNFGNQLPILMQGEMGWPLHWYLRGYSNITAPVGENADNTSRPLVMVDWQMAGAPNLQQNYHIHRFKVREWWEPRMLGFSTLADIYLTFIPGESSQTGPMAVKLEASKNEWRRLWHYLAYREIWLDDANPAWSNGANEFALCIRKDLEERLGSYQWLSVTQKRTDVPVFRP